MSINFKNRILVSITGSTDKDWQDKLQEIKKNKITKIALFLEIFSQKSQRQKICQALVNSCVKEIPLVHIRDDMDKDELRFLAENFKTNCFTIHESHFKNLKKWHGYYKKLYLEMNYDNFINRLVDVNKIGGFCVDLSHFKAAEEKWSKEFVYVLKRRNLDKLFKCNHLNGYDYKKNIDLHTVKNLKEFDYLQSLPEFVFGDYIGIEVFNSIKDQLKFKEYLVAFLNKRFLKK
ncbi:MAG: hypothetical protein GF365_02705 [Candidatus Buchananbacteria bacterium]|nr:hypothetical protein [Candidatus Buchananbacteria bacterium]